MKWFTPVSIALLWSAAILVLLFGFQPAPNPTKTPNPMKINAYQNQQMNSHDVHEVSLTKLDK